MGQVYSPYLIPYRYSNYVKDIYSDNRCFSNCIVTHYCVSGHNNVCRDTLFCVMCVATHVVCDVCREKILCVMCVATHCFV